MEQRPTRNRSVSRQTRCRLFQLTTLNSEEIVPKPAVNQPGSLTKAGTQSARPHEKMRGANARLRLDDSRKKGVIRIVGLLQETKKSRRDAVYA
jgi:hypothetical protein